MSNRYLVRRKGKGWMVYDRERKGPALLGVDLASNLTTDQAKSAELILIAGKNGKQLIAVKLMTLMAKCLTSGVNRLRSDLFGMIHVCYAPITTNSRIAAE